MTRLDRYSRLPSGSIAAVDGRGNPSTAARTAVGDKPARPIFKLSDVRDALIDVFCVLFGLFFMVLLACAVGGAVIVLLYEVS